MIQKQRIANTGIPVYKRVLCPTERNCLVSVLTATLLGWFLLFAVPSSVLSEISLTVMRGERSIWVQRLHWTGVMAALVLIRCFFQDGRAFWILFAAVLTVLFFCSGALSSVGGIRGVLLALLCFGGYVASLFPLLRFSLSGACDGWALFLRASSVLLSAIAVWEFFHWLTANAFLDLLHMAY